jgi:hypothetical protein
MADPASTPDSRFANNSTHISILTDSHAVIGRYGNAIGGYLKSLLGKEDAEDATNDFMVLILGDKFSGWKPGEDRRFRDYLKSSVRKTAINVWRRNRRSEPSVEDLDAGVGADHESPDAVWLRLYRRAVLDAALKSLKAFQEAHPGNVFATIVRFLEDHAAESPGKISFKELAEKLKREAGREKFTESDARVYTLRARRKLAGLLLEEVRQTRDAPTAEQLEEELKTLGLWVYVCDFLPGDWRTRGELTTEVE